MIQSIILNALLIVGVFQFFKGGNAGHFIVKPLQPARKKYPWVDYLTKPFYSCMRCMSSVWGLTFYLYNHYQYLPATVTVSTVINIIIHLLCVLGTVTIIDKLIENKILD